MSKQYHIVVSEEDIDLIIDIKCRLMGYEYLRVDESERWKKLYDNFEQSKQKPYTNFDKIKDEMTAYNFSKWD